MINFSGKKIYKAVDLGYLECKLTEQDIEDPDQFEFMLSQGFSRK